MVKNKRIYIIAYDISSNKRRRKIYKLLKNHGIRLNYSVFECFITKKELKEIKEKIKEIISKKNDSVLFYSICSDCITKREHIGYINPGYNSVQSV